jgi:predicted ATP-dependent endonuclease of OLD family
MRLDNFQVKGFRAFGDIELKNLCEVNMLVGKNNIGKTTLLEALRICLTEEPNRIADLLLSREEFSFRRKLRSLDSVAEGTPLAFEALFYGRPNLEHHPQFSVGPLTGPNLTVKFVWVRRGSVAQIL